MLIWHILLYCILVGLAYFFAYQDQQKKRKRSTIQNISFIIPCYNDGQTVAETIRSIYENTQHFTIDVVVVNDKSTDNSLETLQRLQNEYGFLLFDNPVNLGKAETLNQHVQYLKSDIFLVVDADVWINKKALEDILSRIQYSKRVAAVSCPYIPRNTWFLPLMQQIEYNQLRLVQGSYNVFSAISLWWWCLAVRKDIFLQVGKFSLHAITEDMDLAFKINQAGWRVQQSFHSILTTVPDNRKSRYKQKMRWNSWWTQAFLHYVHIWIKNPLHVFLITSFNVIMVVSAASFYQLLFDIHSIADIINMNLIYNFVSLLYDPQILLAVISRLVFVLLSLPYIVPLIRYTKKRYDFFWILPFSLIYIPVYAFLGLLWTIAGFRYYVSLKPNQRAR